MNNIIKANILNKNVEVEIHNSKVKKLISNEENIISLAIK